jgi:hypothetical protein
VALKIAVMEQAFELQARPEACEINRGSRTRGKGGNIERERYAPEEKAIPEEGEPATLACERI